MSEKKDYKYKIKRDDSFRFVGRIYGDTPRQNMKLTKTIVDLDGTSRIVNVVYKPTLNVRTKSVDIAEGKKTSCEYGEFIAHKMLEKMGIPSCKVEFIKRYITNPRSKSGKGNEIPGVLSYIELGEGETLVSAQTVISRFKQNHKKEFFDIIEIDDRFRSSYNLDNFNDINNNNIEVVIPAFMTFVKEDCRGTNKKAEEIKQSIIDMVTFDCMFANRDRHSENYGLALSSKNGKVRFYPLYDNEYILGFSEPEKDIGKYSATGLQEHINNDLYSVMGVNSKPAQLSASAMMAYLFSTYPMETQKAYEKVAKFTVKDLEELMDECEGLPETHKAYALRIFKLRSREIETIEQEFIDKEGKPILQKHLPGNKPNEHVKGSGSSNIRRSETKSRSSRSPKKGSPSLDD